MASDLVDIGKVRVTKRTRNWLEAKVRANPGVTLQEVLRDRLDEMAAAEIHAARVMIALTEDEGRVGDSRGHPRDTGGRR